MNTDGCHSIGTFAELGAIGGMRLTLPNLIPNRPKSRLSISSVSSGGKCKTEGAVHLLRSYRQRRRKQVTILLLTLDFMYSVAPLIKIFVHVILLTARYVMCERSYFADEKTEANGPHTLHLSQQRHLCCAVFFAE